MSRGKTDQVGFVHLHMHTAYSLREGALTIDKVSKLALADHQPALAITDTNNLFCALEFSEKLTKMGIQPIIGVQLMVDFGDSEVFGRRFDSDWGFGLDEFGTKSDKGPKGKAREKFIER